jgi:hypothetical protein
MNPYIACCLHIVSYRSVPQTLAREEEVRHFRLFLFRSVNCYYSAVTYLSKVHSGGTEHHTVADPPR